MWSLNERLNSSRRRTSILLLLFILGIAGCDSEIEIPLKVSKNFWYKYENATATQWTLNEEIYTVTFTVNNFPKTAFYNENGEWISTSSPLPPRRSMICVRDFLDEKYPNAVMTFVEFVEGPTSERYFVTIERTTGTESDSSATRKSEESGSFVLEFDSDCGFIGEKL